jgi:hypothetical protein
MSVALSSVSLAAQTGPRSGLPTAWDADAA